MTVLKQAWYESSRVVTNAPLAGNAALTYADFRQRFLLRVLRREASHEKQGKVVDLFLGGFDRASAGAFMEAHRGNPVQEPVLEAVQGHRVAVCQRGYCVRRGGRPPVPGLHGRVPRAVVAARSSKRGRHTGGDSREGHGTALKSDPAFARRSYGVQ